MEIVEISIVNVGSVVTLLPLSRCGMFLLTDSFVVENQSVSPILQVLASPHIFLVLVRISLSSFFFLRFLFYYYFCGARIFVAAVDTFSDLLCLRNKLVEVLRARRAVKSFASHSVS